MEDIGRIYIIKNRVNNKVYIGKTGEKEIDFVAMKRNEKIYIQVCEYLDDKKTFEREYRKCRYV